MIFNDVHYNDNITIDDQEYDLSIFRPVQRRFTVNGIEIPTLFEFTTHVFSVDSITQNLTPNVFDRTGGFRDGNDRTFDNTRYINAKDYLIPFITEQLHADWVLYPTHRNNHFCCIRRDYHIYFKFHKTRRYTRIIIKSAFNKTPRQEYIRRRGQIITDTFGDLIR